MNGTYILRLSAQECFDDYILRCDCGAVGAAQQLMGRLRHGKGKTRDTDLATLDVSKTVLNGNVVGARIFEYGGNKYMIILREMIVGEGYEPKTLKLIKKDEPIINPAADNGGNVGI